MSSSYIKDVKAVYFLLKAGIPIFPNNYFDMSEKLMTAKEAIEIHLSAPRVEDGKLRYSAYIAALRDARLITGRNSDTGEKPDPIKNPKDAERLGCWLGAIGYLSLLDQIGKCFKPNAMTAPSEKREIIKALTYFSNLNEREKYAIYALRCSFAHDFSLFNIPESESKKVLLQHHFGVGVGNGGLLISLPDQGHEWMASMKIKARKIALQSILKNSVI